MALTNVLINSLNCRLINYSKSDPVFALDHLNGIPAFSDCLICGVDKTSGLREVMYFIPAGEKFEDAILKAFVGKDYELSILFFKAESGGFPVFNFPGIKPFRINAVQQVNAFVSVLDYEIQHNQLSHEKVLSSTLLKIIHYLLSDIENHFQEFGILIREYIGNERLVKILKYIHANLNEEIVLEQIADLVFLSPDYISQFFKRSTGISIQTYVINERVKSGMEFLITTLDPISVISEKTGFTDQAYFNRRFKANYSINPLKYRKLYLKAGIVKPELSLIK